MRRIKIWLFIIPVTVLLFTSCYKEYVTEYVQDPSGAYMDAYYIDVEQRSWTRMVSSSQEYWYISFSMPEITKYVVEEGMVVSYLIEEYDNMLPYVASYDDGSVLYTRTIRFDIKQNLITFFVEDSDLSTESTPPNMTFKVCIVQNY